MGGVPALRKSTPGNPTYPAVRRVRTFAALGDSFNDRDRSTTGTINTNGYVTYFDACNGMLSMALAYLCGRVTRSVNAAVTGTRVDQWLSAGQVGTVVAAKPDACLVTPPTNDRAQGTALATSKANYLIVLGALRAAGILPVVLALAPHNSITAAEKTYTIEWNLWLRTLPGIILVDPMAAVSDAASGNWRAVTTQWTSDGLHPTDEAVWRIAYLIAQALEPHVADGDLRLVAGLDNSTSGSASPNLLGGSSMTGTAGSNGSSKGGTGTVVSNFSLTSSNGSNFAGAVASSVVTPTVPDMSNMSWQQHQVTTAASALRIQQTGITGFTAGSSTVRAEIEIDTDSDVASCSRLTLAVLVVLASGSMESRWVYQPTAPGDYPANFRLTKNTRNRYPLLWTPTIAIPSGATSLQWYLDFTGLGTIRWRAPALRLNPTY